MGMCSWVFSGRLLCFINTSPFRAEPESGPRASSTDPAPSDGGSRPRGALGSQGGPAARPCTAPRRSGDHFEWNKVTSCIHNILSGQRWIEHYGEVLIRNTKDSSCHCKITFCKVAPADPAQPCPAAPAGAVGEWGSRGRGSSLSRLSLPPPQAKYWSSSIHEVQGAVFSRSGRVLHRLFGKWNEGLFRGPLPGGQCIWKPSKWGDQGELGRTEAAMAQSLCPSPCLRPQTRCPQTTSETSASLSLRWS